jgi:Protein of unknown function (DUF3320)
MSSEPRALPSPTIEKTDRSVLQLEHDPVENGEQPRLFVDGAHNPTPTENIAPVAAVSTPDPERFYDLSYVGELRQMVQEIISEEAPLPVRNLGREIANRHGWQRTGRRIMERAERAMGDAELHDEFGVAFVWAAGTIHNKESISRSG